MTKVYFTAIVMNIIQNKTSCNEKPQLPEFFHYVLYMINLGGLHLQASKPRIRSKSVAGNCIFALFFVRQVFGSNCLLKENLVLSTVILFIFL